jgi:hypothetical protein
LKQLPTELDDIYHAALERIYCQNTDDVLLAERVLSWIFFAGRTLTVKEMQHAIAILNLEPEETRIDDEGMPDGNLLVSVCAGLVMIDKENGVIRLVHYTAQQYFESIRDTKFPHAEVLITQACLRYLSLETVRNIYICSTEQNQALTRAHPLLVYAACYWGYHAVGEPQHLLKAQIMKFLAEDSRISYYFLANVYYKCPIFQSEGFPADCRLWLATDFSLEEIVNVLLQQGVGFDLRCMRGETPLITAARLGKTGIVKLLLDHGANINLASIGGATYCTTALDYAAWSGNEAMAELLLKQGANINYKDESEETALVKATQAGQLALVRILLSSGADLRCENYDALSPIDAALVGGNREMFQLLMDAVSKTDFGQKYMTRTLFKQASGGTVEAFDLILTECRRYGLPEEVLHAAKSVHDGTPTRLVCDNCEASILDTDIHFHCEICNSNDFDLCKRCVYDGQHCLSASHQIIKRHFREAQIFVAGS